MKVQAPTLGPIIGYTTDKDTRIWIRGEFQPTETTEAGYSRVFGVGRISGPDGVWKKLVYVKMPPYFDVTGVLVFEELQANTVYTYEVGWFFAESEFSDEKLPGNLDWTHAHRGTVRTSTPDPAATRSYVIGSCRYLLRLFGGKIFDDRGDKTFGSILTQLEHRRTDGLIMMGDQIYADDLKFIAPDTTIDEFIERYRSVFDQDNLRELMGRIPTYMILDDHEIEDNWPINADDRDWKTLYPAAMHAYQIYQASHSPVFQISKGKIDGTPTKFWYTFQDGCCDWFVVDCRNERVWDPKKPAARQMISPLQLKALLDWLNDGSGRVKMVVTSVPFFPDLRSDSVDKWSGYTKQRAAILDHIYANGIRKVVFFSGDVHCSFSSELVTTSDPKFQIISVISSSFFWPYPHMSEGDFELKSPLSDTGAIKYKVANPSEVHSTDNFSRVTVTPAGVTIEAFTRKGDPMGSAITRAFRV